MDIVLIVITTLAVIAVLAESLREAFHDGPAAQGPPRSHVEDERFMPPTSHAA